MVCHIATLLALTVTKKLPHDLCVLWEFLFLLFREPSFFSAPHKYISGVSLRVKRFMRKLTNQTQLSGLPCILFMMALPL